MPGLQCQKLRSKNMRELQISAPNFSSRKYNTGNCITKEVGLRECVILRICFLKKLFPISKAPINT